MPTLAELDVRVDSTQIERGTKALNDLAAAAKRAAEAAKIKSTADLAAGDSERKSTTATTDATKEYDLQAKKLRELAEARKKLEESNMKNTDPEKYKRELAAIDATVGKLKLQGNAQDQLQAKWDAMEEAARRASERQKGNIDSVISGLSRQAKAQIDYNRTLEDLNRAKGLGSGKVGGISEAEYESYKKLAQAQRDNALAAIDNSKEMARAQAQIDSVASTLGKAEKAQYLYAQRVKQITEASKLLGLTEQQVTALIEPHTKKLQEQLAVINANGAAQEKFNTQLRNIVNTYDPVIKANETYTNSVRVLIQGLTQGKITIEQYNGAMKQQADQLERVKNAQPNSEQSQAKRYQDALDRLLPYNVQLRNLEAAEKALNLAQQQGRVTTEAQITAHNKAREAIAAERAEVDRLTAANDRRGNSAKQNAAALRGLPAQFTDVVVSLQGGQAPLTVLLQQGGQVKDMFGGLVPAFKAVGGALLAMITPLSLVGLALAGVALGANAGAGEIIAFNKAVITSGNYAGLSGSQFATMRTEMDNVVGTARLAAEALTLLQASGKVAGDQFLEIGLAAVKMSRATGVAIKDIVADFVSLGKDPVNAATTLDEKYKFLTASIIAQAEALVRTGESQEATILLQKEMTKAVDSSADRIVERAGYIERAWRGVKDVVSEVADGFANIGRVSTAAEELQGRLTTARNIENSTRATYGEKAERVLDSNKFYKENQDAIKGLQLRVQYEEYSAKLEGEAEQRRVKANAAQDALTRQRASSLSPVESAKEGIELAAKRFKAITDQAAESGEKLTDEQINTYKIVLAYQEKRLKDALASAAKTTTTALDTRELTDVKVNLAAIEREYDHKYKAITTLGKAGVVSQEATVAAQLALLQEEKDAVEGAYNEQIKSIEKLQGVKGNNVAQTISLDNQLTKAQDAALKAQEDISAKMEELKVKEKARLDQRADNIKSYSDALKASVDNIEEQGRRQVAALAKGDRQGKVDADLAGNDRNYAKGLRDLDDKKQTMDPEEYAAKLEILRRAHDDMSKAILKNDADIKLAEEDWTNGVTKAYENYVNESANLAGMMSTAVSGAFKGMEDSLTSFVLTGKSDFESLATSIIDDLARIAVKMAASQALQSLVGMGMSMYSGGASAGTGTMSGFSENLTQTYAKGGAFDAGTQYFAQGGAFTNGIVNSPTAFPMGGGRGVMGEAGPEAIVPLARSADGSLGVRMTGANSSKTSDGMEINIYISDTGGVSADAEGGENLAMTKEFGRQIGEIAAAKYHELLKRDLSDGGAIKSSMAQR